MLRKLALAITLICCLAILTACNIMKGFGKDVQGLGEKMFPSSLRYSLRSVMTPEKYRYAYIDFGTI